MNEIILYLLTVNLILAADLAETETLLNDMIELNQELFERLFVK